MKTYRAVCTSKIKDIQLETLSDNQINVFSFSLPLGIESEFDTYCDIYEIERKGDEEFRKKVGFIKTKVELDEGMLRTEYEVSDSVVGLMKKFLF